MLNKILTSSKTVSQTAIYRLRNNINVTEELCLEAVKQYGRTLEYVPKHLKTESLCLEAIKQRGMALQYVPKHLRTEQLCLEAVKQNGYALYYVPKHLKQTIKKIILNIKWNEAWGNIGAEKIPFSKFYDSYNEPHRFYHNQNHIFEGIIDLFDVKSLAENYNELLVAWLLHDIVYDVQLVFYIETYPISKLFSYPGLQAPDYSDRKIQIPSNKIQYDLFLNNIYI